LAATKPGDYLFSTSRSKEDGRGIDKILAAAEGVYPLRYTRDDGKVFEANGSDDLLEWKVAPTDIQKIADIVSKKRGKSAKSAIGGANGEILKSANGGKSKSANGDKRRDAAETAPLSADAEDALGSEEGQTPSASSDSSEDDSSSHESSRTENSDARKIPYPRRCGNSFVRRRLCARKLQMRSISHRGFILKLTIC
jgi:hypothetical protein